jgi:hypothetical protein
MLPQIVLTLTLTLGVRDLPSFPTTYIPLQRPACPQIFDPNNTRQTGVLKRKEKKKARKLNLVHIIKS